MILKGKIITVGLSPAWDIKCCGADIEWGRHSTAQFCSTMAAGKALNVSKGLAWLKCKSIAAGLWGVQDLEKLKQFTAEYRKFITLKMTPAKGFTRENYWIVNPHLQKEMHIRNKSNLETLQSIAKLKQNLKQIINNTDIVVFSGALSDKSVNLIKYAATISPHIVLDTSGPVLKKLVYSKKIWLIKPNFEEFSELLGKKIINSSESIITNAKKLLAVCPNILVSRGDKGAVFINEQVCISEKLKPSRTAKATVGCGDFALAGFLAGLTSGKTFKQCLKLSVQTGSNRALGHYNEPFTD